MSRRLPRADKRLILPRGDRQASASQETDPIILPGSDTAPPKDEAERKSWEPTIYIDPQMREIDATTLAEEHQGMKQVHRELQARDDAEDWGDGWTSFAEPAHILRGPDGSIVRITPLSEIPGIELTNQEKEQIEAVQATTPKTVPMNRDQRHKLKSILAGRMWKYYRQLPMNYQGYNPFRDGLPLELAAGDPRRLAPHKSGAELTPATDKEIYDWLYEFVGKRTSVVDKRRGFGGIQDMALRIE